MQEFAVEALRRKRRDVALEINQAVRYPGSPRPAETAQFIETVKRVTQREEPRPFAQHRPAGRSNERGYRPPVSIWATLAAVFSIGALVLAYVSAL